MNNPTEANLTSLDLKGKASENQYARQKEAEQLKALKASLEKKQEIKK